MNRTLIVLDDLTDLISSKNPYVQRALKTYIEYVSRKLTDQISKLQNRKIFVAGPRELLTKLNLEVEFVHFEKWFDTISFDKAGSVAVEMAESIVDSKLFRSACPGLIDGKIFTPKIGVTRLAIALCYNPINHFFMIQNMVNHFKVDEVAVLSGSSEIEKIALAFARSKSISVINLRPNDLILKCKSVFLDFVYFRDRRLHLLNSFKPARLRSARFGPNQRSKTKKRILMIPAHSLHFRMLIPLTKALNNSGQFDACVLLQNGFENISKQLDDEKISSYCLSDLSPSQSNRLATQYKQIVCKCWKQMRNSSEFQKLFSKFEIEWFSVLFNKIRWYFIFSFSEILLLVSRIRLALKRICPDAIVCFSDSRFIEVAGAAIAKEMKIPAVQYSTTFLPDTDAINQYDTCNFVMTVGQEIRNYIASKNRVPEDNIVTVGDIRFDETEIWRKSEVRLATRRQLGLSNETKVFTLVSFYTGVSMGYTNFDKERLFEIARDAIKNVHGATLIIKAHPNEKEEVLAEFVKKLGMESFVVTKTMSLFQLFGISSGVISLTSISCIEALACDTPVIIVNLADRDYDYYIPFKRNAAVPCAENAAELTKIMVSLIEDRNYHERWISAGRSFVLRYIDRSRGPAKNQIVKFFELLFEKRL